MISNLGAGHSYKTKFIEAEHCIETGQLNTAATIYEQLLLELPDDANLYHTVGLVYFEQGKLDLAIERIERSISINPGHAKTHRSLGDVRHAAGQHHDSIAAYQRAIALDPGSLEALINLGNIYHELDQHSRAVATFQKVIDKSPDHLMALNNIGKTLQDMGMVSKALEFYNRCFHIDKHYAEARFNRAVALLTLGDYRQGWLDYEWRFRRRSASRVYPHMLDTPKWRGESYIGRRLLVHCEQGLGDVIQFTRYLPMVKQLGGTLILEAHPPLLPLIEAMDCVDERVAFKAEQPPTVHHDVHIPLMSLPSLLNTRLDAPLQNVPYLHCDTSREAHWKKQMAVDGLKIGMVWSGSQLNPKRNCPLHHCRSWFQIPGIHFFSLQKGPAAKQLSQIDSAYPITALGHELQDFMDTAAVMANLDLIISVDTAAVHLAGALAKPVWVLLPYSADWRWPHHSDQSPWYPSAKLFHQTIPGNWSQAIAQVKIGLERLQNNHLSKSTMIQPPEVSQREFEDNASIEQAIPNLGLRHQPKTSVLMPSIDPHAQFLRHSPKNPKSHSRKKIKKVLLVSPIYGGSMEVIQYLHTGFKQAGLSSILQDNSKFYPLYQQINQGPNDEPIKDQLLGQLINAADQGLMACVEQFKPDIVLAIAQSPIGNDTVAKLKDKGITTAYWFVEDHRFRPYWMQKAPMFDFFFTIQRDADLKREFEAMGHPNWHYLPLACDPGRHRPYRLHRHNLQPYRCQIGFMGAPYLNRLNVFEELAHWDLGIWGEGWDDTKLSSRLTACVKQGSTRISAHESMMIYCGADIIVNLHSSPFDKGINAAGDFVNPRTFEVAGCAGFQLSDYRKELPKLFSPGEEIILFDSIKELKELIDYWLPRPELRSEISRKAQKRAYEEHTYQHRAEQILKWVEK